MADPPIPPGIIMHHPPDPFQPRSNMPMLYYGLFLIGTAAVVLALYHLITVRWCTDFSGGRGRPDADSSWRLCSLNVTNYVSSFKYKKRDGAGGGDSVSECVVCLTAFEEGEELRQLPECRHSFHAPCIDMWLYSHMDCPLCRCVVGVQRGQSM